MIDTMLNFPAGFVWGAATSGYQIEGSPEADGKGPSIWDTFVQLPGKILHGDTGRIACNTYDPRQLDADLDLIATCRRVNFDFARYRRPEVYGLIAERAGPG